MLKLREVTEDKTENIALLMTDLKRAEERADKEGWIDADSLEKELEVFD